jgi:carboxyl-terminal processing protease
MKFYKLLLYSFLLLFFATACHDDDNEPVDGPETPEIADAYTQRVNDYIYQAMKSVYLWTDQIPELDRQYETDPKAYFRKLLVEEDIYSGITDDLQALLNSSEGIEKAFGYSLAYTWADESQSKVWGVVEYVYPNTPASKAGIKRGGGPDCFTERQRHHPFQSK